MTMKSSATALWQGDLKQGNGAISADSGAFEGLQYTFATRFEGAEGTNPEELIAAAHAGCYSMALSNELAKAGMTPQSVLTSAEVTLEMLDDGPSVTRVHLTVNAVVPGADQAAFDACANGAKEGCPISKLLNADITLDTKLTSKAA